jgi:hypothetical protein
MSFDKESEEEFKLIKLANDNDADLYFKLLSVLDNNKQEQQRLRAIIDAYCLEYLKSNKKIANELFIHKYDKNTVINIINESAIKELNNKIDELSSMIKTFIKEHGINLIKKILVFDHYTY